MTGIVELQPDEQRHDVHVALPDGRRFALPRGTTLAEFATFIQRDDQPLIVAMLVDGTLRELSYALDHDAALQPIDLSHRDGALIYRRSLIFLLVVAAREVFPGAQIAIEHAMFNGGYFGRVRNREQFSPDELQQIEDHMRSIVADKDPFARRQVPLEEAISIFNTQDDDEKLRLLRHRTSKPTLVVYELRDHCDYMYGYKVPHTGYLQYFALEAVGDGFVLRYPRRHAPTTVQAVTGPREILGTFREHREWLDKLGITNVGALNDDILAGRAAEISLVFEALHEQRIADVAHQIVERPAQLVLISGPSSSGKTTFSKRLAIQLLAHGAKPFTLPIDDYFVNRDDTPRDEHGQFNFEALEAVDLPRLNSDLVALMHGEQVTLPHFNFKTGLREMGDTVRLGSGHVIIMEGIHALNPRLISAVPLQAVYRIYISALTALNLDNYNRVSTTDLRLIRRIVRDARYRGFTAANTLARWESVRNGEKNYIFPHQDNADYFFNSSFAHELSVMRPLAEPLLLQVRDDEPENVEAKRLRTLLGWFRPLEPDIVPDNSLLREFIGGSLLRDFRVWRELR